MRTDQMDVDMHEFLLEQDLLHYHHSGSGWTVVSRSRHRDLGTLAGWLEALDAGNVAPEDWSRVGHTIAGQHTRVDVPAALRSIGWTVYDHRPRAGRGGAVQR